MPLIPNIIQLNKEECNIETEKIHSETDDYKNSTARNYDINIMLVNIRSINKNHNNFLTLLNGLSRKPDVLVCTETRNLVTAGYFNISGYEIYFNESNANDGVLMYVNV